MSTIALDRLVDEYVLSLETRVDRLKTLKAKGAPTHVLVRLCEVLGRENVIAWILRFNPSIGTQPVSLMETGDPKDEDVLLQLLGRIEHGVYG